MSIESAQLKSLFGKKTQSQPLRIEHPKYGSFVTARCINSQLWFVNNRLLEEYALGMLAKYCTKFDTKLYAFVMQGNHYHHVSRFPGCNRAAFQRDFGSRFVNGVRRFVPGFPGGPLFERRYSTQALVNAEDIEEQFLYAALQPVKSGLTEYIEDYPGYNSFFDAIWGRERTVKVFRRGEYNERKRYNRKLKKRDFMDEYTLRYDRVPGYDHLSQEEYAKMMLEKVELRRQALVADWKAKGHKFLTRKLLERVTAGTVPKTTKKSKRNDERPLVLSKRWQTIREYCEEFFPIYWQYKDASERYLRGEKDVVFPPGTYRPPGPFTPYPENYKF
ncbi:MAG: hypothetical protein U0136_17985 [Bdellovibrionota bacterium]